MSECFHIFLCILTLKSAFLTNILLNMKCIVWCLSFSEMKKIHSETLKFVNGDDISLIEVLMFIGFVFS